MTQPLPGPLDEAPTVTAAEADEHLTASLTGLRLGTWDEEIVTWVRAKDPATIATLASLLERAKDRPTAIALIEAGASLDIIRTAADAANIHQPQESLHRLLEAIDAATL